MSTSKKRKHKDKALRRELREAEAKDRFQAWMDNEFPDVVLDSLAIIEQGVKLDEALADGAEDAIERQHKLMAAVIEHRDEHELMIGFLQVVRDLLHGIEHGGEERGEHGYAMIALADLRQDWLRIRDRNAV